MTTSSKNQNSCSSPTGAQRKKERKTNSLVGAIREAVAPTPAGPPCVVAIDQEGGLVQRLRAPLTVWPDMLSVGTAGDPAGTEQVGRALGAELAALGIGWDFAPVLDVHTNPDNPVIGNRAFGTTADVVAVQALAFLRGLRAAGVIGCGKHFPGHGDTRTDSHLELPVVDHAMERLRRVELAPFAAAARAGGHHDGARVVPGARSRSPRDVVSPDSDRTSCGGSWASRA